MDTTDKNDNIPTNKTTGMSWSADVEDEERRKTAEKMLKQDEDIKTLRAEYDKEKDIRVKTGLLKYMNIIRKARQKNEVIEFPGGASEMIIHARQARQPIHLIAVPTLQLTAEEKLCYNSTVAGEIYADKAYKGVDVQTVHKDYMKQSNMPCNTKDFDSNRYMNSEDYRKCLITKQRLSQLLDQSGLGLTRGPTIETFGPEGRQASTWYYGWIWAKEWGQICGICKRPEHQGWHHAFNKCTNDDSTILSTQRSDKLEWQLPPLCSNLHLKGI